MQKIVILVESGEDPSVLLERALEFAATLQGVDEDDGVWIEDA